MSVLINSGLLNDALRLTQAGSRVFPVDQDGKPLFQRYHGVHPFSERELLAADWAQATFVGLALPPESVVLDVDHKDGGKSGWDHLRWLEGTYGSLPTAPSQSTMSAGVHILLRLPKEVREKALAHKAILPTGEQADIDILRHTHRYARVHSVEMWLNVDWDNVPLVPDSWLGALLTPERNRPTGANAASQTSPIQGFQDALRTIADASEGRRNATLSAKAFGLFLRGYTSESDTDAVRNAAIESGLPLHEIDRVLGSARKAAWQRYLPVADWINRVHHATQQRKTRSSTRLVTLAVHLAERSLIFPQETWIGLSSRDAAELIGVGAGTAHSYLVWLKTEGLIRQQGAGQPGLASGYQIVSHPNTCPPPQEKQVFGCEHSFGALHLRKHYRTDLAVAPAFQRMGGKLGNKPTLRPTAYKVLIALESGPMSIKDLITTTGASSSSVRRAVQELESCALVRRSGKQVIPEFTGDCEQALREWSEFHQLELRDEVRRKRHDSERYEYGDYLMLKHGVPIKGHAKGRLRRILGTPEFPDRIRHDLRVHIERRRGRPVQAVLERL